MRVVGLGISAVSMQDTNSIRFRHCKYSGRYVTLAGIHEDFVFLTLNVAHNGLPGSRYGFAGAPLLPFRPRYDLIAGALGILTFEYGRCHCVHA